MYDIGVVPGKFFPPHRGHLFQIIRAATMCKRLLVVVSDNETVTFDKCRKDNLPCVSVQKRALWLSQELQGLDNIEVHMLDESNIPLYPDGSEPWAAMVKELVTPEHIDVIFGGEEEYQDVYMQFFPGTEYDVFDYTRSRYPVSGTEVRNNCLEHWDYILGSARSFFARRILITGTESCAKSTLTKYLAKIFHTSWSEEYGRHYAGECLGGNDKLFSVKDFLEVAWRQYNQDAAALKGANKICFFDTDAIVTQYYCELYTGSVNPAIEQFVDPQKYDVVLFMSPTVEWVPDGDRFVSDQSERERLHRKLLYMYLDRGFKDKIIEINDPEYSVRLHRATSVADMLLGSRDYMSRY
jgi:HTH-type transcriptional repressor of NAD biosynthesis genes